MNIRYKNALILSIIFIAGVAFLHYTDIDDVFTLSSLQAKSVQLKVSVDQHYTTAVICYLLIFTTTLIFGLPVVGPMTLLGGYLFGAFPATAYAIISQALGATLSFMLIRYVFHAFMTRRYKKRIDHFQSKIDQHGAWYLLTLQFMVVVPFFVINVLAALTEVPMVTVLWTTAVGCAPLTFAYALAGRKLATLESIYDIFSFHVILAFVLLIVLVCLPTMLKWLRIKPHDE